MKDVFSLRCPTISHVTVIHRWKQKCNPTVYILAWVASIALDVRGPSSLRVCSLRLDMLT